MCPLFAPFICSSILSKHCFLLLYVKLHWRTFNARGMEPSRQNGRQVPSKYDHLWSLPSTIILSCQYFPFPPSERATKSCFRQKRKVRVTKLGELSCDIQNMSIENNLWYHSLVSSIFLLSLSLIKILWVLQATLWWPQITSQPDWSAHVRFDPGM